MKARHIVMFAALLAGAGSVFCSANQVLAANGTAVYFDVSTGTSGFGSPSGTYNLNGNYWNTSATGGSAGVAAWPNNDQMTFGTVSTDLANSTFTVNMNETTDWSGLVISSSSANITLNGTGNAHLETNPETWTVAAGSTLTEGITWKGGANFNSDVLTLQGGGTFNFTSMLGCNSTALITQNTPGGIVNLDYASPTVSGSAQPYSGGYTLTAGTLNFQDANSADAFRSFTSATPFTINGGAIGNTSNSAMTLTNSGGYSIGGSFTFVGSNSLSFGNGPVVLSNNPTITVNENTLTIGGVISGAGQNLTLAGSGTLNLANDNSFTGNVAINGGTLSTGTGASGNLTAMGSNSGTRTITVNTGGTLLWTQNNIFGGSGMTAASLPTIALNGGTFSSSQYNAIGNVTLSGGTLFQNYPTSGNSYQGFQFLGSITVSGTASSLISSVYPAKDQLFPTSSGSTTFNVGATGASPADLVVSAGLTNVSGDYGSSSGTTASGLIKTGLGTMLLTAGNTYSGVTLVNNGTLVLGNAAALSMSTFDASGGGQLSFGTLATATFGGLQGVSGNLSLSNAAASPVALSVGNNGSSTTYSGVLNGNGSLTMVGAGMLTLSGSNSYSGPTNIAAGTLLLTGSGSIASSAINITAGAVFDVSGLSNTFTLGAAQSLAGGRSNSSGTDINGSLISGGTINDVGPSGPGTLTINGSLTLTNGGYLTPNLGTPSSPGTADLLSIAGSNSALALTGTTTVPVPSYLNNGTYTIIGGYSTLSGAGTMAMGPGIANFRGPASASISVGSSAVTVTISGLAPASLFWTGSGGSNNWDVVTTQNWYNTSSGSADYFYQQDAVTFNDSAATTTVNVAANVYPSSVTVSTTGTYTLGGSGSIGGPGGLTMNGPGSLVLTSSNAYSGGTNINGGTLSLGNNTSGSESPLALGSGSVSVQNSSWLVLASGDTGTYSIANALALNGGGIVQSSGNQVLAGSLTIGSGGGSLLASGSNSGLSVTGVISGSGPLALGSGGSPGSIYITNSNPYSGTATVNSNLAVYVNNPRAFANATVNLSGGTLDFGQNTATFGGLGGSSNLALTSTAGAAVTLTLGNNNGTSTYSGALSGGGGLTMTGAGMQTLSGSNSYLGNTTVNGGTLVFSGSGNSSLPGTVTVGPSSGNPGTLVFQGNAVASFSATNDGAFTVNYGSTLLIQPGASVTLASDLKLGSQASGSSGTLTQSGGILTITNTATGRPLVIGEYPAETSAYNLNGGVLNATGNWTYLPYNGGGIFNISAGTANLYGINFGAGSASSLNLSAAGVLVIGAGGLDMANAFTTTTLSGGTLAASANWSSAEPMTLTLNNTASINPQGNTITLSGSLSGAGALNEIGTGNLITSAANTLYGGVFVNGGTLEINGNGGSNGEYPNSAITVASGAVLAVNVNDGLGYGVNGPLTIYGTVVKTNNESETIGRPFTLSGGTMTSTSTVTNGNGAWNFYGGSISTAPGTANFITGAGGFALRDSQNFITGLGSTLTISVPVIQYGGSAGPLNVTGSGTLVLTASNNYTGVTNVSGSATLSVGADNNLGQQPVTATANSIVLNGGGLLANASFTLNSNRGIGLGSTTASTTGSGALGAAAGQTLTYNGILANAGSASSDSLVVSGPGTLLLGGSNTYTGGTSINGGTLGINADAALGSAAGSVTFANNSTLQAEANNIAINSARGLTINNGATATIDTQGNAMSVSGAIGGSGALTKIGAGGLTLSGSNTYGGPTNINVGTLVVNGSLLASGSVNVNNSATLSGTGSVGLTTVNSGGILDVSQNGTNTFNLGSLTFNGVGTINLPTFTSTSSVALQTGALTTNGGLRSVTINLGPGDPANGLYPILAFSGAIQNSGSAVFNLGSYGGLGGRQQPTLEQIGSELEVNITGFYPIWSGANGTAWVGQSNWVRSDTNAAIDFQPFDTVYFSDTAGTNSVVNTTVDVSAGNVNPTSVTFNNNVLSYTITGSSGIGPTAALTMTGSGTVTIANTNFYGGGTTLSNGILNANAVNALGTAGFLLVNSGTLNVAAAQSLSSGTVAGGVVNANAALGDGPLDIAGGLVNANAALGSGAVTVNGGTVNITAAQTLSSVTASGGVVYANAALGSGPLAVSGGVVYANAALGPGALTVSSGTLNIAAAQALSSGSVSGGVVNANAAWGSGPFSIAGGLVNASVNSALGTGALTISGGTLDNSGAGSITLGNSAQNWNGSFTFLGSNPLDMGTGNVALGAPTTVTLNANTLTVGGGISGGYGLTLAGSGALVLTGPNTYNGNTTVSGGTLAFNGPGNSLPGTMTVSAGSGNSCTLLFEGNAVASFNATADSSFTVNWGSTLLIQPGASVTVASDLKLGGLGTGSSGSAVQSGGVMNVSGEDTGHQNRALVIGEYPNETSAYTLIAGVLNVSSGTTFVAYHATSGSLNISGGTANLAGIAFGQASDAGTGVLNLSGSGALYIGSGGMSAASSYTALVNLSGGTLGAYAAPGWSSSLAMSLSNTTTINPQANTITLSGVLSGAGGLTEIGAGNLTLSAGNIYSGTTLVSGGTLALANSAALSMSTFDASGGGRLSFGTLTTATFGGLQGASGNLTLNNSSGTAVALSVGNNGLSTTYSGAINGNGSLALIGAGMLTLFGSNTYGGGTTVSSGTLAAGALGALSDAAVNVTGGVLDVTAASQTVSLLTVGSAGALNINDQYPLTVSGTASFASLSTLNIFSSGIVTPDLLMSYGTVSGTFGNVYVNGVLNGLPPTDSLSYLQTPSGGSLEIISSIATSVWASAISGSWSTGPWTAGVPNAVGAGAIFSGSANTALTVTLDAPQTVGTLAFGNTGSTRTSYTLSGSTLTLNNSTSSGPAMVTVLGGTHDISAPLQIAGGNLVVAESNSGLLGISGNISDDSGQRSLTLAGDGSGQLILSGTNSYGGGTTVEAGTLIVNNSAALPAGSSLTVGAGGTFIFDPSVNGSPTTALPFAASAGAGIEAVPEPGTGALLLAGAALMLLYRKRRQFDVSLSGELKR